MNGMEIRRSIALIPNFIINIIVITTTVITITNTVTVSAVSIPEIRQPLGQ